MESFEVVLRGRPAPQGSKRAIPAFKGKGPGREWVANRQVEMSPHVKNWRDDVKTAAEKIIADTGHVRYECPVRVSMVFTVDRAAKPRKGLRLWPAKMPDLSKLCRSTEDALSAAGVWKDDALVVEYTRLAKVYPGADPEALPVPGVRIIVIPVLEEENA